MKPVAQSKPQAVNLLDTVDLLMVSTTQITQPKVQAAFIGEKLETLTLEFTEITQAPIESSMKRIKKTNGTPQPVAQPIMQLIAQLTVTWISPKKDSINDRI